MKYVSAYIFIGLIMASLASYAADGCKDSKNKNAAILVGVTWPIMGTIVLVSKIIDQPFCERK